MALRTWNELHTTATTHFNAYLNEQTPIRQQRYHDSVLHAISAATSYSEAATTFQVVPCSNLALLRFGVMRTVGFIALLHDTQDKVSLLNKLAGQIPASEKHSPEATMIQAMIRTLQTD